MISLNQCIDYYYNKFLNCTEINENQRVTIFMYLHAILLMSTEFLNHLKIMDL